MFPGQHQPFSRHSHRRTALRPVGTGVKPSASLQRQAGPIQPLTLPTSMNLGQGFVLMNWVRDLQSNECNRQKNTFAQQMATASVWGVHQLQGVEGNTGEVPEGVKEVPRGDIPGTGSWCPMGACQWEMQDGCFRLKNNMSKCTTHWERWEQNFNFSCNCNKPSMDGPEGSLPFWWGWETKVESPSRNNGGTSCPREVLQHGSHDPSWFLMISYKRGYKPFLQRAGLGYVQHPTDRFTLILVTELYPFINPTCIEHLWCTMPRASGPKVTFFTGV